MGSEMCIRDRDNKVRSWRALYFWVVRTSCCFIILVTNLSRLIGSRFRLLVGGGGAQSVFFMRLAKIPCNTQGNTPPGGRRISAPSLYEPSWARTKKIGGLWKELVEDISIDVHRSSFALSQLWRKPASKFARGGGCAILRCDRV